MGNPTSSQKFSTLFNQETGKPRTPEPYPTNPSATIPLLINVVKYDGHIKNVLNKNASHYISTSYEHPVCCRKAHYFGAYLYSGDSQNRKLHQPYETNAL